MNNVFSASIYILKRALRHDKKLFWVISGLVIVSGITPYMYMIIMAYIIDGVEKGIDIKIGVPTVLVLITIAFFLNVIKSFLDNTQGPLLNDYRQKEKRELNKKALSGLYQKLETAEFWDTYQKAQLSVRRNYTGNEGLLHNIIELFISVVPFWGAIIAIRELDVVIVGIILITALIGNLLTFFAEKIICRCEIQLSGIRAEAERFIKILFNLDYQKDVRVCGIGKLILDKYGSLTDKIVEEESAIYKKNCKIRWVNGVVLAIQEIVIYLILIYRYKDNQFDIADWTLLISAMTMITFQLSKISSLFSQMKSNTEFVCGFRSFMEKEEQSGGNFNKTNLKISADIPILALKDADFYYKDYHALNKINLNINRGERIAIVGLNGAGKSTLIKLLVGLYQPSSGDVYLAGRKSTDYDRSDYYQHFSCVFQEINTYPFSLLTNISLQKEIETDATKVLSLLQTLTDEQFVENLPKKEYTVLSRVLDNEGVELSGGQKQMVSLCRAFYRDTEILVFDEPTAALDPISEKWIFEKINEIAKGKTVIYVSHRLISTMFCDKIILLQDGSIQECGSHEQLMSYDGLYAELYRMQTSYYKSHESMEKMNAEES